MSQIVWWILLWKTVLLWMYFKTRFKFLRCTRFVRFNHFLVLIATCVFKICCKPVKYLNKFLFENVCRSDVLVVNTLWTNNCLILSETFKLILPQDAPTSQRTILNNTFHKKVIIKHTNNTTVKNNKVTKIAFCSKVSTAYRIQQDAKHLNVRNIDLLLVHALVCSKLLSDLVNVVAQGLKYLKQHKSKSGLLKSQLSIKLKSSWGWYHSLCAQSNFGKNEKKVFAAFGIRFFFVAI